MSGKGITRRGFMGGAAATAMAAVAGGASAVSAASATEAGPAAGGGAVSVYEGTGHGFQGDVTVHVAMRGDEFVGLDLAGNTELYFRPAEVAAKELGERIVAAQSLAVDTVAGATFSSRAILDAASDALSAAGYDVEALSPDVEPEQVETPDAEADILVVGGGIAGLTAAMVAASENLDYRPSGLKVTLIDACDFVGGSSATSGGGWSVFANSRANVMNDASLTGDQLTDAMEELTGIEMNRDLLRRIVEVDGDTADRIFDLGSPYSPSRSVVLNGKKNIAIDPARGQFVYMKPNEYAMFTSANGYYATDFMLKLCQDLGVEVRCGARATELIMEDGEARGVKVEARGSSYSIRAKKTILATGGFALNPDMVAQYAPEYVNSIVFAGGGSKGDGIRMALEQAGASVRGYGGLAYLGTTTRGLMSVLTSKAKNNGLGLWVDVNGNRFDDSRSLFGTVHGGVNRCAKVAAAQPEGKIYSLFDSTADYAASVDAALADEPEGIKADTVEELAAWIGCDASALEASVESCNQAIESGEDKDFGVPVEYLNQVKEPPFYAVELRSCLIGTLPGLDVTEECEVRGEGGEAVPNLYACGEIMLGNMMSDYYLITGGSFANCIPSARIAAEAAKASL